MKSEATRLLDRIEDSYGWLFEDSYTPRTSDKGDGYWCPIHEGGCYRSCSDRRWGKYGAAGILFFHRETKTFLLNQRSNAIHHGGTWSTLGGAIDRNETAYAGALREAIEEVGNVPDEMRKIASHESSVEGEHGTWTYTTFVVEVDAQFAPGVGDWESIGNEWVTVNEMATMRLHPGFKSSVHAVMAEAYMEGAFS